MLTNAPRHTIEDASEELSYPLANTLTKLIGRLVTLTGGCVISTGALLEGDTFTPVVTLYGCKEFDNWIGSAADTCCPPTTYQEYQPIEMDILESPYASETRKRR